MSRVAVFDGLVVDELDNPVDVVYVGSTPHYVVDDDGFMRHILAEQVDRQVLNIMLEGIEGHEEIISEQAAKMTGQDDSTAGGNACYDQFRMIRDIWF